MLLEAKFILLFAQRPTMSSERRITNIHKFLQRTLIFIESKALDLRQEGRAIRARLNASKCFEDTHPVSESRCKQLLDVRHLLDDHRGLLAIINVVGKVNKRDESDYDFKQFDQKREFLCVVRSVPDFSLDHRDWKG